MDSRLAELSANYLWFGTALERARAEGRIRSAHVRFFIS
jgi:hypothetical protein